MYYVLKYKSGKFVGEDSSSGGYPYETEYLFNAKVFTTRISAEAYLISCQKLFYHTDDKFDSHVYQISVS